MGVLDGKVAVVTGGAQGIGKGIVVALAKEGAHVVITDVAKETLLETVQEVEGLGVRATPVIGDIGLPITAPEAVRAAQSRAWPARHPRELRAGHGVGRPLPGPL